MPRHTWIPGSLLVAALLVGSPWPGGSGASVVRSANAQPQGNGRNALPPGSLAWFRELFALSPRQAAAGTRSELSQICVITPWPGKATGNETILVHLPRPTIATVELLDRFQIVSADASQRMLYERRATSREPLQGPFAWPAQLPSLQPGETVTVKLQRMGAREDSDVVIRLKAIAVDRQQRAQQMLASRSDRLALVEEQARSGQTALAAELLFAPLAAPSRQVEELRAALMSKACKGSDATAGGS